MFIAIKRWIIEKDWSKARVPVLLWLVPLLVITAFLASVILSTNQPGPDDVVFEAPAQRYYRIVAVGDIACDPDNPSFNEGNGVADACQSKKVARAIANERADAVLLPGDIQYDIGLLDQFQRSFAVHWRSVTQPMYVVPGNHDYGSGNLDGYLSTFPAYFPNATYQSTDQKTYYSFDLGSWSIYALDSNCPNVGGCDTASEQFRWLEQVASQNDRACSMAFWHHPVFTSGIHNDAESTGRGQDFWSLLDAYGVDVVINGHDHHYERFMPMNVDGTPDEFGIREFVSGLGGRSYRPALNLRAGSEKIIDNTFGYLKMELYPQSYNWEFKDIEGNVLDRGVDTCR